MRAPTARVVVEVAVKSASSDSPDEIDELILFALPCGRRPGVL
ncbi:hypothetical protein ACQPZQ_32015 [Pseudonocardia sp. CA-142604]